ncbi:RES family NAD+ phosphorylase [Streptomyces scopuliridis]
MTAQALPDVPVFPHAHTVPAGTVLWRVHKSTRAVTEFNPRPADPYFGGSRFDSVTESPYPFLYTAPDPATALAEVLLRDRDFDMRLGVRVILGHEVAERTLSALEVTEDLRVVSLCSAVELAAVCQDGWLVEADGPQYAFTRRWARYLRDGAPWGQGLRWQARRNRPLESLMFFGDRLAPDALKPSATPPIPLGTPDGIEHVNELLAPLRAVIFPPVPPVPLPVDGSPPAPARSRAPGPSLSAS